ncbi:MAG: GMC family oxidoreductase [Xanthomonadales bacterium]|nr:GMC family oxidoreductase [Xanthomonadales bacterium]
MIKDANQLSAHQRILSCDLLIVGGGVAGLTLCQELKHSSLKIILLESGGLDHSPQHELLNRGQTTMYDAWQQQRHEPEFMQNSRCRRLGGSGHLWGGKCASLDPIDFTTRRWFAHSGWPIDYAELKPYLDRACERFQIPHFQTKQAIHANPDRPLMALNQERVITTGLRRYTAIAGRANAQRYQQFINDSCQQANVTCYLHATATQLIYDQSAHGVSAVCCQNSHGKNFTVSAPRVVLAAGGLENTRLLMYSNRCQQQDVGSQHQQLGRYFMGHVIHRHPNQQQQAFRLQPNDHTAPHWRLYRDKDPQQLQGIFQLSQKAQRRDRLPNTSLTLNAADSNANSYSAYLMQEQHPNVESRLELSGHNKQQDALAVPQLELSWYFSLDDTQALCRAFERFKDEFEKHEMAKLSGCIEVKQVLNQLDCARHHMGTTRMHRDPQQGVVNEHCRVHGCDNLYISGASVFPTGGIANPTLAITALAMRLAAHLYPAL